MNNARPSPSLILVTVAFAGLLGLAPEPVAARSDTVTAEAPPVGPFQQVEISGHAELILVQGDREAVLIEASPTSQVRIRVRSKDGRLRIDVSEQGSWWGWFGGGSGRRPTVTVHFKTLEALDLRGAVKATATSIRSPKLRVHASGAASMKVDALEVEALRFAGSGAVRGAFAGSAGTQEILISGAGAFRSPKLVSQTAAVTVSGAGKVVVNAQKQLDATISGAGAIEYLGDPVVKQQITGAGKITRRWSGEVAPKHTRALTA